MSALANTAAFPTLVSSEMADYGDGDRLHHESSLGMTLRQYYAGLAMQGLLTTINFGGGEYDDEYMPRAAKLAVLAADALIAELEKP